MESNKLRYLILGIVLFGGLEGFEYGTDVAFAQAPDDPPVRYEKKIDITLSNPLDIMRNNEPVIIPLRLIREKAQDFNRRFFRVKHQSDSFEPLDIPSQIRMIPSTGEDSDEIVFQITLGPHEVKSVEVWYNPQGAMTPEYPVKTQSSDSWYRPGTNLAWENEVIAYRSYDGIIDFFGKTYLHLRLNDLLPDSYHHERVWGIDPYVVGKKPGLGGILLFEGAAITQCYGSNVQYPRTYVHQAFDGGPVVTGGVVTVQVKNDSLVRSLYSLFAGCYENIVRSWVPAERRSVSIAPGMEKFENGVITIEKDKGIIAGWGSPLEEYGTIGTALIWNPADALGIYETDDGVFVKLKQSPDNSVTYLSCAVWSRASTGKPQSSQAFLDYLHHRAECFRNPVKIQIR